MEALDCPRARVEDGKTPDMLHATDSRGGACEKHIYLFFGLWSRHTLALFATISTNRSKKGERYTLKISFRV